MSAILTEENVNPPDTEQDGGNTLPLQLLRESTPTAIIPVEPSTVKVEIDLDATNGSKDEPAQDVKNNENVIKLTIQEEEEEEEEHKEDEKQNEDKAQNEPLMEDEKEHDKNLEDEEDRIDGSETPTLPLPEKKSPPEVANHDETGTKSKHETPSMFLHPIDRLRKAWAQSTSVLEFFIRATCIIFASVGWLFLVGGIPLISIVQLIIGSIYLHDCPAEPKIPKYLIVSGVFGSLLHCTSVITKYAPRNKEWPTRDQRRRCICFEIILQVFLLIWFLAGCSWVYGIYEPEYEKKDQDNYCHKTVYLFTFWIFNLSFIVLALIFAIGTCCIICIAVTPSTDTNKKERNVISSLA